MILYKIYLFLIGYSVLRVLRLAVYKAEVLLF